MVKYGLIVSVIGFFMYIVGTIFYNYHLRKNNPDLLENHSKIPDKIQPRWSQNKKSNTSSSSNDLDPFTKIGWYNIVLIYSYNSNWNRNNYIIISN